MPISVAAVGEKKCRISPDFTSRQIVVPAVISLELVNAKVAPAGIAAAAFFAIHVLFFTVMTALYRCALSGTTKVVSVDAAILALYSRFENINPKSLIVCCAVYGVIIIIFLFYVTM